MRPSTSLHQCRLVVTKRIQRCAWDRDLAYGVAYPLWHTVVALTADECMDAITNKMFEYDGQTLRFMLNQPYQKEFWSHGKIDTDGSCYPADGKFVSEGESYEMSTQSVTVDLEFGDVKGELDVLTHTVVFPRLHLTADYAKEELHDHKHGTIIERRKNGRCNCFCK